MLFFYCAGLIPFSVPLTIHALAELTALFGTEAIENLAMSFGKTLIVSERRQAVALGSLCQELAKRPGSSTASAGK